MRTMARKIGSVGAVLGACALLALAGCAGGGGGGSDDNRAAARPAPIQSDPAPAADPGPAPDPAAPADPEPVASSAPPPEPEPDPAPAPTEATRETWRPGWWLDAPFRDATEIRVTAMGEGDTSFAARSAALNTGTKMLEDELGSTPTPRAGKIDGIPLPDGRWRVFVMLSHPLP